MCIGYALLSTVMLLSIRMSYPRCVIQYRSAEIHRLWRLHRFRHSSNWSPGSSDSIVNEFLRDNRLSARTGVRYSVTSVCCF